MKTYYIAAIFVVLVNALAFAEFTPTDSANLTAVRGVVVRMEDGGQVFVEWQQMRKMAEVIARDLQRLVWLNAAMVGLTIIVVISPHIDFFKR